MNRTAVTFNHNPLLHLSLSPWRARLVRIVLLAGMAALLGFSLHLQTGEEKVDFLKEEGKKRHVRVLEVPAARGRITDRNDTLLAFSTQVSTIWAIPSVARPLVQEPSREQILEQLQKRKLSPEQLQEQLEEQLEKQKQLQEQVPQLAQLLGMSVSGLKARIADDRGFVYLKRQVSPELAGKIMTLKLPGIYQRPEFRRFYPSGEVMAHMLGYTDIDDRGQEGVERVFDRQLTGEAGFRRVVRDLHGQVVENEETILTPRNGQDVVLAMDAKIQYLAYSALRDAVRQHRAKAGSVVVIDARTGEILAMVNAPAFNPNNRASISDEAMRNLVFTDAFEPGSIMKPFVAAMAIESGKFRATTQIDTFSGSFNIGNRTIHDTQPYRTLTVAEIIQKSSNIGAARLGTAFKPEHMWAFYDRLGFGSRLGFGFPGEASGNLRPAKNWKLIEQATMSYGHGVTVSLIQIARAYLAFARDGDLVPLSLTRVDTLPQGVQVFSPQVAREMRRMMEMAVGPGGTGARAQIPGYRVAGKTGTANKIENGRYVSKYISSFVGFVPASNPRLVVAVMIDNPSGKQYYGGAVAAPVFAQVAEGALRTLGVAPDMPLAPLQLTAMGNERESGGGGM
ncbi:MAG: penicillin-binding protein 2 [Azoarcus sp.]|jgi:cell division protein FtsI (penicillin-binding protein 3)|nr:penicillin-binding protein 2 [Azoarcus sp.]